MNRRDLLIVGAGAAAWPLTLRAQQKPMPVIGYVGQNSLGASTPSLTAFRRGVGETGYVEGQNVAIEYRWAEGHYDRLPAFFADLVARKVDVIVAGGGTPGAVAAKGATSTIPIVFTVGVDPVEWGLIASLSRPGGNLTGISVQAVELVLKRFELISELVLQASVIPLLVNSNNPSTEPQTHMVQEILRAKGVELHVLTASSEAEIDAAFSDLRRLHASALVVGTDPFFFNRRDQLVMLASRYATPATYEWREFAEAGGLLTYGPSLSNINRQVGVYVGKILKGEKPADLPVQQPTKFELVINLKTATALGLTIPQSFLQRADDVIE
jgi:putative ABC transport system substrate-binding protein